MYSQKTILLNFYFRLDEVTAQNGKVENIESTLSKLKVSLKETQEKLKELNRNSDKHDGNMGEILTQIEVNLHLSIRSS